MSEQRRQFTGLILVTGTDSPGITQALFDALSPFKIAVLDIEQVVIRGRLILTVLIELDPAHAPAIESDLELCAQNLKVDIATSFQEEEISSIAAKSGLVHVVALASNFAPQAM